MVDLLLSQTDCYRRSLETVVTRCAGVAVHCLLVLVPGSIEHISALRQLAPRREILQPGVVCRY